MAYPNYSYPAYGGYNPITPFEPRNNMMQQMVPPQNPMGYGQPMQQPMMDMNQQMGQMQQPVMQQPSQPQQNAPQMQQPILMPQVKVVASLEEANAVQVDFNGYPIIMPQVLGDDITAIYMKRWNLKEGRAEFKSFSGTASTATGSVNQAERSDDQPRLADTAALISLDDLQDLQDLLDNMKKIIREQEDEIQSLRKSPATRPSSSKKGEDGNAK